MSGPNDSGGGDTPTGDFKLPLSDRTAPQGLSPRFRLQLHWDTPRLQWRPTQAVAPTLRDQPAFLKLDDPLGAVALTEQYILSGSLLFDMRRPRFDLVDKAFLDAPTTTPHLLPSFAEMKAWEDEAFYRRLGRTSPLRGAPAPPTPMLTPPVIAAPPPSPFYKLPDPYAMSAEPPAPKAGSFGDILKALHGLPIVQRILNLLSDEGLKQTQLLKNEWDKSPWLDRITVITLSAPIAASVVGTVLGVDQSRHLAFKQLKGADIPVPFVPGLSVHVADYGKADPFLLGARPNDPHQPQALEFGLKLDVLKAIPAVRKVFQ
jgi:hypothetical protein